MNYFGMVLLGIVICPIIVNGVEWISNILQLQTSKITVKSCYLQNEINKLENDSLYQETHAIGFQVPDDEEWSDEDYE